jgi:hypothetical protein
MDIELYVTTDSTIYNIQRRCDGYDVVVLKSKYSKQLTIFIRSNLLLESLEKVDSDCDLCRDWTGTIPNERIHNGPLIKLIEELGKLGNVITTED